MKNFMKIFGLLMVLTGSNAALACSLGDLNSCIPSIDPGSPPPAPPVKSFKVINMCYDTKLYVVKGYSKLGDNKSWHAVGFYTVEGGDEETLSFMSADSTYVHIYYYKNGRRVTVRPRGDHNEASFCIDTKSAFHTVEYSSTSFKLDDSWSSKCDVGNYEYRDGFYQYDINQNSTFTFSVSSCNN